MLATQHKHINPPYKQRVKTSTIYHISVDEKIQPLQYSIQDKNEIIKHYLPISIAPHITISHYHKMKGQRQIISSYLNDHNLLNAERYTTDGTIPPYKTTSI